MKEIPNGLQTTGRKQRSAPLSDASKELKRSLGAHAPLSIRGFHSIDFPSESKKAAGLY